MMPIRPPHYHNTLLNGGLSGVKRRTTGPFRLLGTRPQVSAFPAFPLAGGGSQRGREETSNARRRLRRTMGSSFPPHGFGGIREMCGTKNIQDFGIGNNAMW